MADLFKKLNLGTHGEIWVLGAPASFEAQLATLANVRVHRKIDAAPRAGFVIAFLTRKAELDRVSRAISTRAQGDAVVWIAYPKGTSKAYDCDFNRDSGWEVLRAAGFDTVRQVAIDADWSALRFRRQEFIERRRPGG